MPEAKYHLVIVGAGVSGLYAAYRLSQQQPDRRITILEASERPCGRLYSKPMPGVESIPAELGGMFFNQTQALVYSLCVDHLGLSTEAVNLNTELAYLRNHRFSYEDFEDSSKVPYFVNQDESGLPYHQLLFNALSKIVPDLKTLWPINSEGSLEQTIAHLRGIRIEDAPLQDWGFWNLLLRSLSNEAYQLLLGAIGSFSMLSNWNGYDAVLSLVTDMGGQWYKLPAGYQTLPETLLQRCRAAGVALELNTPVRTISEVKGGFDLRTSQASFHADEVILTCSRGALARIADRSEMFDSAPFAHALGAIRGVDAGKIFLTYDELWWRTVPDGPGKITKGRLALSRTDLPMRQCYYEGTDGTSGRGLIIGAYGDESSVTFWEPLVAEGGIQQMVTPLPERARHAVREQLSKLHGVKVPRAVDGLFVDWRQPPYYGGWHLWNPGYNSSEVATQVQRPLDGRPLFICGETFSQYQGWVEGSLTSTEYLLQRQFGLDRPDWLPSNQSLTAYYSPNAN